MLVFDKKYEHEKVVQLSYGRTPYEVTSRGVDSGFFVQKLMKDRVQRLLTMQSSRSRESYGRLLDLYASLHELLM